MGSFIKQAGLWLGCVLVLLVIFSPFGVAALLLGYGGVWIEERALSHELIWSSLPIRAAAVSLGALAGLGVAWKLRSNWRRVLANFGYDWFAIGGQTFLLAAALSQIHGDWGIELWLFYLVVTGLPPLITFGLLAGERNDRSADPTPKA